MSIGTDLGEGIEKFERAVDLTLLRWIIRVVCPATEAKRVQRRSYWVAHSPVC